MILVLYYFFSIKHISVPIVYESDNLDKQDSSNLGDRAPAL